MELDFIFGRHVGAKNFSPLLWNNSECANQQLAEISIKANKSFIRNGDEISSPFRRMDLGRICSISVYKSCRNSELFQDFYDQRLGKGGLKPGCIIEEVISSPFLSIKKHHLKDVYNDEGFTSVMGLTYGVMLRLEQIFWAIMGMACYASLVKSNPSDA